MAWGGKRPGSGPKQLYGEVTTVMRVPASKVSLIKAYLTQQPIPLYECKVQAGFPSPACDYTEGALDLNSHLIKNPSATFFVRVSGDSMTGAGIHANDMLIVDRSINPTEGKIVIAALDGDLTVKRLHYADNQLFLMPENPTFKPIKVHESSYCEIWGVVTNVIHAV